MPDTTPAEAGAPEPEPETGVGETDESAPEDTAEDVAEATKRKFREALAAKQGRRGEDHLASGPAHAQGHGPVDAKRTFRRKTG